MTMLTSRRFAFLVAACLGWAYPGLAQETPKDDALDKLLKTLEAKQKADGAGKSEGQPKTEGQPKAGEQPKTDGKPKTEGQPKPSTGGGTLAPKDQALDSLLEKLGETEETPSPNGRPTPGPGGQNPPAPTGPGKPDPAALNGGEQDLDQHLEELTGRKRKKKDQQQDGEGSGPLSDVIKQMRDVEQRLGKPDTGEETRQKQEQIVRKIDQVIEQLRNSSGQSGKMTIREVRQAGNKPGGQQGGQGAQGNNANGVGPSRPNNPNNKSVLFTGKHEWGHLPSELRKEMDNVFKEEPLPERIDWISRYYLSVNKKGQSKEE
jgi:hypothetical protein